MPEVLPPRTLSSRLLTPPRVARRVKWTLRSTLSYAAASAPVKTCRLHPDDEYVAESSAASMSWREANFGWPGVLSSRSASGTWSARNCLMPPTASTALAMDPRIRGSLPSLAFCIPRTAEPACDRPAARSRGVIVRKGLASSGTTEATLGASKEAPRAVDERSIVAPTDGRFATRVLGRGVATRWPVRVPVRVAVTRPVPAPCAASSPSSTAGVLRLSNAKEPAASLSGLAQVVATVLVRW